MMYGYGLYNKLLLLSGFLSIASMTWFVIFTILVIKRLGKIIELLKK